MCTGRVRLGSLAATAAASAGTSLSTALNVQLLCPSTVSCTWLTEAVRILTASAILRDCNGIHKGRVRVGFWVGNCAGYGSVDAYTGWDSVSRIYIEEVPYSSGLNLETTSEPARMGVL